MTQARARLPTFPVVLAGAAAFLNIYSTQPLLPLLTRTFGASTFEAGLTITAPTVAVALFAPFIGRLADRLGFRRVIILSAWTLVLTTALAATVGEPASADLLALPAGGRHARDLREHRRLRPRSVAAFARRPRHRRVHDRDHPRRLHRPRGLGHRGRRCQLAGGIRGPRDPDRRRRRGADDVAAAEPARAKGRSARTGRGSFGHLVRNRRLVATCGIGFTVLFTQVAMFTYVTFHLAAPPYSLSTVALGWLFVVYLVGAVVTPFAGHWIDRYGHRAGIASAMAIGGAGALLTLVPWLPAIVAGAGALRHRRLHRAGDDEQLHRRGDDAAIARWRWGCIRRSTIRAAASAAPYRPCSGPPAAGPPASVWSC